MGTLQLHWIRCTPMRTNSIHFSKRVNPGCRWMASSRPTGESCPSPTQRIQPPCSSHRSLYRGLPGASRCRELALTEFRVPLRLQLLLKNQLLATASGCRREEQRRPIPGATASSYLLVTVSVTSSTRSLSRSAIALRTFGSVKSTPNLAARRTQSFAVFILPLFRMMIPLSFAFGRPDHSYNSSSPDALSVDSCSAARECVYAWSSQAAEESRSSTVNLTEGFSP